MRESETDDEFDEDSEPDDPALTPIWFAGHHLPDDARRMGLTHHVPDGAILPFRAQYVRATGTDAADILALY